MGNKQGSKGGGEQGSRGAGEQGSRGAGDLGTRGENLKQVFPLIPKSPCPQVLFPIPNSWQRICNVSLEIDIPAEWLRRSFHCL
ncbi:hypothetical protein H6G91_28085 [Nostoc muscorum FACHB-395]|nr:hypothetical protein [Desmonostoc muscorum FACHB-395]